MLHAGLLLALIYVAAQPLRIDAAAVASRRMTFIYTATPGLGASGGGGDHTASAPRPARVRDSRPLDTVAPPAITNVEPLPAAAVPAIMTQGVDVLPGTPMVVDGTTVGKGSGPGGGGGRGPGNGPGDGPGSGDVYDPGVGGVSDPRLIHEVKPNFTDAAMRARIQGVVIINVVVLADGSVDPARIRDHAVARSGPRSAGGDRCEAVAFPSERANGTTGHLARHRRAHFYAALTTLGGLMWPAITRMPYVAGRPILMFGLLGALVLASAVRDLCYDRRSTR